jgi:hypothetical protein
LDGNNGIPQDQGRSTPDENACHRNINNTLKYTQLIKTEEYEFISKVAKTVEEAFPG